VLIATATGIESDHVQIKMAASPDSQSTHEQVPFDYLLVAVGNTYKENVIKPAPHELTLAHRAATWRHAHEELREAKKVVIVGGGLVGVELAAEIAFAMPAILVTLVHSREELCGELPAKARKYIADWLELNRVTLRLGRRVRAHEGSTCLLDDDSVLEYCKVYECTGGEAHGSFKGFAGEALDKTTNYLKTSDTLQVLGRRNVFAAGDAMSLEQRVSQHEIKNGHTAEQTAKMAAMNIERMHSGCELLHYPQGLAGKGVGNGIPRIYCVSLGPHDGVLAFNWLVVGGPIAAILKWLVEWTKVLSVSGRPIGRLFWQIADSASQFISNFVIKIPINE